MSRLRRGWLRLSESRRKEVIGMQGIKENEQTMDESEIASVKKGIIDALGGDYYKCMQSLDSKFLELGFDTPVEENYALMKNAIVRLQKQIQDSVNLEYSYYDYEEVTKELYEELLDEGSGIDPRGRAVIDFVINRLKVTLEGFEVGDEWGPGRDTV
jgi:hypothetical protein